MLGFIVVTDVTSSNPAKKGVREELSPVKRRSPRKKPAGKVDKENCPSPRKSPRKLAGRVQC